VLPSYGLIKESVSLTSDDSSDGGPQLQGRRGLNDLGEWLEVDLPAAPPALANLSAVNFKAGNGRRAGRTN